MLTDEKWIESKKKGGGSSKSVTGCAKSSDIYISYHG